MPSKIEYLNGDIKNIDITDIVPRDELDDFFKQLNEKGGVVVAQQALTNDRVKVRYRLTNTLTPERVDFLVKNIKPIEFPKVKAKKSTKGKDKVMAILNIADFHLNRLVSGISGFKNEYTIKHASYVFKRLVDDAVLRLKASPYEIEKVVLNTGGDFLNSDTIIGTTTAGTPQDDDCKWYEAWNTAQGLLEYAILELSKVAPVYHYYIAGNHDKMGGYYLVASLKARFRKAKNIVIDDEPTSRSVINYGNNTIILAHGDNEGKRAIDLPFIEPTAINNINSNTNIEVLTGHLHSSEVKTKNGVRWEILSSACPVADNWTYEKGFGDSRAEATIMYYDKDGRVQCDTINTKKFYKELKK